MSTQSKIERREAIWETACELGVWTRKQLMHATGVKGEELDRIMADWSETGHVKELAATEGPASFFCDRSVSEPRIHRDAMGRDLCAGGREEGPRGNMWRAMRQTPQFTARDIAMLATTGRTEVSEDDASKYAQMLTKAGYLRVVRKASPRRPAVYRLVANTGPKPPVERRVRCVYDPNRAALTHVPGDQADV